MSVAQNNQNQKSPDFSAFDSIFNPKAVAIIGASNKEGSFGRLFLEGIIKAGYSPIYPIHLREKELMGLKAYASIKDVPVAIDLALLMVPYSEALKIVRECVEKQVRGVVLFTSGFGEKGEEGKQAERELAKIVAGTNTRLIGPNCNGLYSPAVKLVSLPGSLITGGVTTETGTLSVVSQSGSLNDFLVQTLTRKNIRFNKTVSTGNECDLHAEDFLEYYGNDPNTTLIAGYLEGIKDGRRFYQVAKEISKKKPIIIWKGGMTEAGAKSAVAHTGALAGSSIIWETMFKQAGIINPNSFEEMVDCILAFSWTAIPKGRRIAILSSMGGTNIGTTDNCIRSGLEMAKLTDQTKEKLNQLLPGAGTSASNPLDVGVGGMMNPKVFAEGMKIITEDENVDMLMLVADPDAPLSIPSIIEAIPSIKKPVVISIFDMLDLTESFYRKFLEHRIPVYHEPKRAVAALAKMCEYADYQKQYK